MGLRSHNDEDHRVILTRFLAEHVKENNGSRIDEDLLGWLRKHLEAAEADALRGAGFSERSPDRVNQRNGYRERRLDTGSAPWSWPGRPRSRPRRVGGGRTVGVELGPRNEPSNVAQTRPTGCRVEADRRRRRDRPG